jgi:hypothetical protein|tara:strand:+ start:2054 stop:2386 length:333 start_codon:yes stop_codon:yes gene_type:complete
MGLLKKFSKQLEYIKYPKQKTSWNIAGVIKGKNGFYRFDVRDMFKMPDGKMAQSGKTISKAEKMVFSIKDQWVIIDLEELYQYLKEKKVKKVYLDDLISNLDWNIVLPKN